MAKEMEKIDVGEIRMLVHQHAETGFAHTTYDDESHRFHLLMNGDMRAVEESEKLLDASIQGTLSSDPIRNMRYLFIINTGIATRYMIEAGLSQETVFSISDIYIQKADTANTIEEIRDLNREVWKVFVQTVADFRNKELHSGPVYRCLEYIDSHFNEKITLEDLGELTGLNPCYLSELFRKEMNVTFGTYLTNLRVETAKALLTRTEYSYSKIAYSLGFCSQSHFSASFRKVTGTTPREYRRAYYNANITALGAFN